MIKSMTGYGKAESEINGKKIVVEVRSLNSKQLDLSMRVPAIYRQVEYEIRAEAAKRLQRGKVDLAISYEMPSGVNTVTINEKAFKDYFQQLSRISVTCGVSSQTIAASIMPSILRLPEVVQNDSVSVSEDELSVLRETAIAALEHLDKFREQEGAILIADLSKRIEIIESLKNAVEPYEKNRTESIKNRIRESIESMGVSVDNNRLEQEMIYYIEKLDVTEEKVRLSNHCKYFREVASEEQGVGRKLGFIAQEIGREINTLGSKANESNIQKFVVQMKDELEKIKEQLLNIL